MTRLPDPEPLMPKETLTEENVFELDCPSPKKAELYRDVAIKGLLLQVTRHGTRAYLAEYRLPNDSKPQVKLGIPHAKPPKGSTEFLTLAQARLKAGAYVTSMEEADTKATKATNEETTAAIFKNYIQAKNIIPENARRYEQVLRVNGGPLWLRPLAKLTNKEILDQREEVANGSFVEWHVKQGKPVKALGGPGAANDLIEYGSMVFTYHRPNAVNPFRGIKAKVTPKARDKYVFEVADWPRIAKCIHRQGPFRKTLFWLMVLTGARPLAALRMRWDRLDLVKGSYKLTNDPIECAGWKPSTSPEWDYPLDTWLLEMLREHREFVRDDAIYLFPSPQHKREDLPCSQSPVATLFEHLREQLGLPRICTGYATRHTRGTYSEMLFGNTLITQRMLNHQTDYGKAGTKIAGKKMGATGGYVQTQTLTEIIRSNVQQYSDTLQELVGLRPVRPQTQAVFLENQALTIYQRAELLREEGSADVFKLITV